MTDGTSPFDPAMLPAPAEDGFNLSQPFRTGQTIYPNWNKSGRSTIGILFLTRRISRSGPERRSADDGHNTLYEWKIYDAPALQLGIQEAIS